MQNERKLLLIINPISGTDNKEKIEPLVRKYLEPLGYKILVDYTCAHGDATRLAHWAVDNGYFGVIAAGGDGTVNETAIALCDTDTALAIIPCGSGNGLARHLGIPIGITDSIKIISEGHILACDYGSVNRRPFFCTFGVGFDAAVSETFAKQRRRGKFSYLKSAISEYVNYTPQVYTISANCHILTEKAFLIACCNASQYGNNAYIAPEASITDGLLDITIIHAGSPLDTAFVGVDLFTGYINSNTLIHSFRAPAAVIYRSAEGPVHLDGEPITMGDVMSIKCHHESLKIFTPKNQVEFRPIITPIENMMRDISLSFNRIFGKKD
ncbi:MAG: diacylglycerol kinase family lipid kinase [Muribaculaceae bacterium]|nr:diacylglycerol kinase family lipid kinase [Muribaculaceae bacterium]